jgi:hypothetical protein
MRPVEAALHYLIHPFLDRRLLRQAAVDHRLVQVQKKLATAKDLP